MSYLLPGTTVRVYTRKDWGARPAHMAAQQPFAPREAFIHHTTDSDAKAVVSLAQQKARMRAIQAFHMDARGWSDIGYHFVVFQPQGGVKHARIFEARDWRSIPAAQAGHNTGTLPIAVFGNFEVDALKRNTRYAIGRLLISHEAARAVKTLGGHRDVTATSCPGDRLYAELKRLSEVTRLDLFKEQ